HGAPVAAVAAATPERARAALELIDVEWEELEPLLDPEEAAKKGSLVDDEPRRYERGDVDRGFAEADVVVEAEYRTQTVLHNAMETHQSVCRWEGDTLEVYISTQWIWGIRDSVAKTLGLPPDHVRVVCNFMGGGFGAKNSPGDYTYIAIALAGTTGRPVRCSLTRREENLASGNRNATIQRLRAGARSDGTLTALEGDFVNAVGWTGWSPATYGPMEMLYACESVRTVTYGAKLNTPPNAAFRAPGFVEGTFGLECLLDELAGRLELLPLDVDQRERAPRALRGVGRDRRDRRAVEAGLQGEHVAFAGADRRVHPRRLPRLRQVETLHAGARVRAAQDGGVQHPRQREIGRVRGLSARALVAVDPRCRPPGHLSRPSRPRVDRRVLVDDHPLLGIPALDLLLGANQPRHASTASSIRGYAPQRQRFPAIAWRTRSRESSGSASTSAAAETIWPGVQKPHWSASARTKASTSGWSRSPSIVVTSRPSTVCTSVIQESTGTPSSWTVQAPQWPSPQAIFVPVRPSSPRRVSASVRPTGGSTSYSAPLTSSSST
ncbi:MAG TPA: molybdopterin cofactor-binding domain-containing protein, partial [Gaiellaceae bacterium]|nr:molybdopterin cofactor-binding domain-containing protein [Gaiellaceae bacterium]